MEESVVALEARKKERRRRKVQDAIVSGRDLSPIEAGSLLGVSTKTIYRMIEAGKIDSYLVGRLIRIKRSVLDAYRQSVHRKKISGLSASGGASPL